MNELTLMPEVDARRALREHPLRLSVLVPYGAWIGCGTLRVLRLKMNDDQSAVLTVGYESYRRLPADAVERLGEKRS
ncbi:MAG: hypothetical protein WB615_09420 [Candidatus Tumulicola sp.]